MKLFVALVYLIVVVLSGLTYNSQDQMLLKQHGDNQTNYASGFLVGSPGLSDMINFGVNKENNQNVLQREFQLGNKFRFGNLLAEKFAELAKKNEIANYLYVAEFKIARFEGPDIIHPFNYFW